MDFLNKPICSFHNNDNQILCNDMIAESKDSSRIFFMRNYN